MGRALFAVLTAATFAACTSFQPTSSPPALDADADTPGDAGSADAEAADVASDGGPTFCEQQDAAVLCDDFEQPGRSLDAPAPWDVVEGDARTAMALGGGFASPSGLHLEGTLSHGEGRRFKKIVPLGDKRLRWTFRLRIDKLEADGGAAQIVVASFEFANHRHLEYALYRAGDALLGYSDTDLSGDGGDNYFARPPVGLRFDDWMDVRIEFEPKSGDDEFRFFVGAELLSTLRLNPEPSSTIALGAKLAGRDVAFDVTADDVLVTEF